MVSNVEHHTPQRQRSGHLPAARQAQVSNDFFDPEYDDIWPTRMPSSVRRYRSDVTTESGRITADVQAGVESDYPVTRPGRRSSIPARSTASQALLRSNVTQAQMRQTQQTRSSITRSRLPAVTSSRQQETSIDEVTTRRSGGLAARSQRERTRFHWLFYVGLAMLVTTLGWIGMSMLSNWWQVTQDDWHYGRPRTVHVNAVVGHNNDSTTVPSHFISLNYNHRVQVIEFPAGDPSKSRIYLGPDLGPGQDLAVPRLEFRDVNNDHKPDMIISVHDSMFVFINENGGFRPLRPGENIHL
ncbi:MAG: hypothetical protein IMW89_10510 [Ktedonobacteraceae bacterium]|nr:hypothetical protein [Ktedonobacteraceae bacterium]